MQRYDIPSIQTNPRGDLRVNQYVKERCFVFIVYCRDAKFCVSTGRGIVTYAHKKSV
jgi:hypothetical protein